MNFRKTISYELGVEHNVADIFTYKLTGYYKDASNEIGTIAFLGDTYPGSYYRRMNNRYRDIRGFEFELFLPYNKYLAEELTSYDYRLSNRGWYGYQAYFEDLFRNICNRPNRSKPRPRPRFRANLTFRTPESLKQPVMNTLFSDVQITTYLRWEAGNWLTYHSETYPGEEENNIQWTSWHNIDLHLSKGFRLFGIYTELYTEIQNLLNSKFLDGDGSFWNQSLISQQQYLELVAEKGMKPGEYDDPDVQKLLDKGMYYLLYGPTRDIWLGIRMSF
ncbi:MAG: TonB-dependent receptor [candidate division KSB1 bacterium]|nr:TonB-dependent receptor [candidate division KSB1 bacterium]